MSLPQVVSRATWHAARKELLAKEKEFTRRHDALNAKRRRLPMVRIDKDHTFEGPRGQVSLLELFDGRRQLIVQHVMFDPTWEASCPGCAAGLDELSSGLLAHLGSRDTAFAAVSRAPYPKLAAFQADRNWDFAWYSSYGDSFNYDFHVTLDATVIPIQYNYREVAELEREGMGWMTTGPSEQPGFSCFLRDGDTVFHTYSTFARGTEQTGGAYGFLDMTALGRQEEWEEPKGRASDPHKADPSFSASSV
jgi:predicted dithiol-disulfide oxidoreductase (DUF899 family)